MHDDKGADIHRLKQEKMKLPSKIYGSRFFAYVVLCMDMIMLRVFNTIRRRRSCHFPFFGICYLTKIRQQYSVEPNTLATEISN